MSDTMHERPGVYSSYDAVTLIGGGSGAKTIGLVALAAQGTVNHPVLLSSYAEGLRTFGADAEEAYGMSTLLRLLYANGASQVIAVRVGLDANQCADYTGALKALEEQAVDVLVCDSEAVSVQQEIVQHLTLCANQRMERIAVLGAVTGASTAQMVEQAGQLNCERAVLCAPAVLPVGKSSASTLASAAAVAACLAVESDPALPVHGAELVGLQSVSQRFAETEIDTLVRGGVTVLESVGGAISPIRGVTTRTTTANAPDTTWRELTTIRIVDDVIPTVRSTLRSRFARAKNTAQTRGAIRSAVIVVLEAKKSAQIIDDYQQVSVTADSTDPTTCVVEFSFTVAHGLNRIYLTAHITV